MNKKYLDSQTFKVIVENTPLISIDLIIKFNSKVLLGKRVNKPAKGYWFTLGGRVFKDESIDVAIERIAKEEANIKKIHKSKFIGVFEHLYEDSIFEDVTTHYINLGYEIEASVENLPNEQHSQYDWFTIEEILNNSAVHKNVKAYFLNNTVHKIMI